MRSATQAQVYKRMLWRQQRQGTSGSLTACLLVSLLCVQARRLADIIGSTYRAAALGNLTRA